MRVKRKLEQLAIDAELQARLHEKQAIGGKQVQDFECAFCLSFVCDPVMCSECKQAFCRDC